MPSIVSLLPAATDIVAALGAGDQLVGRTHECDWPAAVVRDVPIVTATSLPEGLTSREIADAVGGAPHSGSSIYQVDLARLEALNPDVIITQDLCEMCAVSYRWINDAVRVTGMATTIISLEARTIPEILDSIDVVGKLLDLAPAAARLVAQLQERIDRLPGPGADAPRVLFIEWFDPLMPGGHWVPEQIHLAGGISVPLGPGAHSVPWQWSSLPELAPDVIVLGPCGFTPEQTRAELPDLFARPEWAALPAVRNDQVWIVDGPAYFNRPGPRVVDGAEILAAILSGDAEHTGVAERVPRPGA